MDLKLVLIISAIMTSYSHAAFNGKWQEVIFVRKVDFSQTYSAQNIGLVTEIYLFYWLSNKYTTLIKRPRFGNSLAFLPILRKKFWNQDFDLAPKLWSCFVFSNLILNVIL